MYSQLKNEIVFQFKFSVLIQFYLIIDTCIRSLDVTECDSVTDPSRVSRPGHTCLLSRVTRPDKMADYN